MLHLPVKCFMGDIFLCCTAEQMVPAVERRVWPRPDATPEAVQEEPGTDF